MEFVERHVKGRLVKHARRGNVNGMENFLDIFTTIVRLLYVYHVRGVVKGLVGEVIRCIKVATEGVKEQDLKSDGYLLSLAHNLRDKELRQQALGHRELRRARQGGADDRPDSAFCAE